MLKNIDPAISADLLYVLMSMGHGDDLLVCDINHPAASIARDTVHGSVLHMSGCDLPNAIGSILSLLPLDTFVAEPVTRMLVVDDLSRTYPVQDRVREVIRQIEGREVGVRCLERFDFYAAARRAFAVVRTSDPGPYGCFILRKGVI